MMVEMIFRGELAVLRWGNTHPSNVRETHTNSRQQKISSQESSFHMKSLASQSRITFIRERPKNANWISVRALIFFMTEFVNFLEGSKISSPKITQTTNNQVVAFFKVFFPFGNFMHKQEKHITSASHTITPRSLGQKRCSNLSERWIAADASALRESPDPSLPPQAAESAAWRVFQVFRSDRSHTSSKKLVWIEHFLILKNANRNATGNGRTGSVDS